MSFSPPQTPTTPSSRSTYDDISNTMLKLIHLFIENEIDLFERTCQQIKDLCDGVILYSLMHILIPTHFPLHLLKTDAGTNRTHRASNIRALLSEMSTFLYSEVLSEGPDVTKNVDVDAIISCNPQAIHHLLELIMFCAIHSPSKEDVVTNILTMSDSEQSQLMHMIESIQSRIGSSDTHDIENFDLIATPARQRSDPITPSTDMKSSPYTLTHSPKHVTQHNTPRRHVDQDMLQEMETEKQALREQFDMVTRENRTLTKNLAELNTKMNNLQIENEKKMNQAIEDAISTTEQRYHEQRKSENTKYQQTITQLETKLNELNTSLKQITAERDALGREKKRHMDEIEEWKIKWGKQKDELELSKETSKKLIQTEAKLQHYKQKLEESSEYKQQYQEADEENARNLATIVSLEAEVKNVESLRQQITKYKQTIIEMTQAQTESRILQEETQAVVNNLKDDITTLTNENKNKSNELNGVRNELEKLKLQSQQTQKSFEPLSGGLTPEIKQKIIRLEAENKQLRDSMGDTSHGDLKNDLDVAKSVAQANEGKYLAARRQVLSLENQIKKLTEQLTSQQESTSHATNTAMQAEAASAAEEIQRLRQEKIQLEETIQLLKDNPASTGSAEADAAQAVKTQEKLLTLIDRNKKLEAYIKQQQMNMKKVKENVMKKQSEIIQTQETLKKLKSLCEQRENEILEFEKLRQDDKATYNRERKLLTSAFYSIGMEYQSALMAGRARDASVKAPASWLSRQRAKPSQ